MAVSLAFTNYLAYGATAGTRQNAWETSRSFRGQSDERVSGSASLGSFEVKLSCQTKGIDRDGLMRLVCRVDIANTSETTQTLQASLVKIVDTNGNTYVSDRGLVDRSNVGDILDLRAPLQSGAIRSGYLGFRLPTDATSRFFFLFNHPSFKSLPNEVRAKLKFADNLSIELSISFASAQPNTSATTGTPDFEATIQAQQTTIAILSSPQSDSDGYKIENPVSTTATNTSTPLPTATATLTPTRTPTPRPTVPPDPYADYPAAVASIARSDSATECDEIGWSVNPASYSEDDFEHVASCAFPMVYVAACADVTSAARGAMFGGPSGGDVWIACTVFVGNAGTDSEVISPFDFALVTGSNHRYNTSFDPIVVFPSAEVLEPITLPPDQNTSGTIWFVVSRSDATPFRIEIEPPFLSGAEPGVIIMDYLLDVDEFI
jgi:hypothetical protein